MHDTLRYIEHDPLYRRYHHNDMTFGLLYAFSEHFVLPLSHDEVVYGKRSLIGKMPGDHWQRFANLRAYLGFMWTHPGKKLLFMGGEIAQEHEWSHDGEVDWPALGDPLRLGVQRLVRDLNRLYGSEPALHQRDAVFSGFRWVVGDDRQNSVFAFLRYGSEAVPPVLVVCNMTPVPHARYRVGVPRPGEWLELLNSDAAMYGGSNMGNGGSVATVAVQNHGEAQSLGTRRAAAGGDVPAAARRRGPHGCSACLTHCFQAGHFHSARHGMGWASTSRSSRRTRNASTSACSTHRAGTRSPARRCRNTPTRSGTAICPRRARACSTAIARYGPYAPHHGHRFNHHKLLIDPYARCAGGDRSLVRRALWFPPAIRRAATCRSIGATARRRCRKAWWPTTHSNGAMIVRPPCPGRIP